MAVLVFTISFLGFNGVFTSETKKEIAYEAKVVYLDGGFLSVNGEPNVRSYPRISSDKYDASISNSFGKTVNNAVINTDRVLVQYKDSPDETFVGIDVTSLDNIELKKLPKGVSNDMDGIVWINIQYIDTSNWIKSNETVSYSP